MTQTFIRKQKSCVAIQLTVDNVEKVLYWSGGKLRAFFTGRPKNQPPIEVESTSNKDARRYSMLEWWLLMYDDGTFDVMVDSKFKEEYEAKPD